jgi:hypothetical protein
MKGLRMKRYAAPSTDQSKIARMERLYDQVAVYLNPCAAESLHALLAEVFEQGQLAGTTASVQHTPQHSPVLVRNEAEGRSGAPKDGQRPE